MDLRNRKILDDPAFHFKKGLNDTLVYYDNLYEEVASHPSMDDSIRGLKSNLDSIHRLFADGTLRYENPKSVVLTKTFDLAFAELFDDKVGAKLFDNIKDSDTHSQKSFHFVTSLFDVFVHVAGGYLNLAYVGAQDPEHTPLFAQIVDIDGCRDFEDLKSNHAYHYIDDNRWRMTLLPKNKHVVDNPEDYYRPISAITYEVLFALFVEVQEVVVKPGKRSKPKKHKGSIKNPYQSRDIIVADIGWDSKLISIGKTKVKGHNRLQPHGKERKKLKLIWIDQYEKKGYIRKPGKAKLDGG